MIFHILIASIMLTLSPQCCYAKGDTTLLHYIVRQPKVAVQNPPLLILLHGVGSDENDLFSLGNQLNDSFLIVSARAPFTISERNYKWYDVDFSTGKPRIDAQQAEKSRIVLIQFLNQLKEKHVFDSTQVYLAGFSQGAIMAFSVGLTRPDKIKGIIAMGGRVLDEIQPNIANKKGFGNFKALILHGKMDNVLPIQYARNSKTLLDSLNVKTSYYELETGHTITAKMVGLINKWL
jgi:phospholipase/carboxylesterase